MTDKIEEARALARGMRATGNPLLAAVVEDVADECERLRAEVARLKSDRRERNARAMLSAFVSNNSIWESLRSGTEPAAAVQLADALIAELDKEPSR